MKLIYILSLSLLISSSLLAQHADSDPAATQVLKELDTKYSDNIIAEYALIMEMPGEDQISYKGDLKMSGQKYLMNMGDRKVFSDGDAQWLYLSDNNEVQIYDAPDPDDIDNLSSPVSLFNFYKSDQFIYGLVMDEAGKQHIEFKPIDRTSDIAKIRLELASGSIKHIKVFNKGGDRYTLNILSEDLNQDLSLLNFSFNEAQYPGVIVEDLRID